jgi:hypothetical protein
VLPDQITISEDGLYLYIMMYVNPVTLYKMDESNGNFLKKYEFDDTTHGYGLSRITFKSATIFMSGYDESVNG